MTGPGEPTLEAPRATGRTALFVAVAVGVVLAAFVWLLASSDPQTDRSVSSPLLGKLAPAIVGETVDGRTYDLDDHRGEFVVVNFFATWCTPCVREHPELVRFADRHAAIGDASVVSVVYDDPVSDIRQFFDERGGDWPVVIDPDNRISLEYSVTGVPESIVVAPDGTVLAKLTGGVTALGLDRIIDEAIGR